MHAPSRDGSTEIEIILLSDHCFTSKPPRLDRSQQMDRSQQIMTLTADDDKANFAFLFPPFRSHSKAKYTSEENVINLIALENISVSLI